MKEFCYIIITGGFLILGAIIGGICAYYTAIKTIRIQFSKKAAASFRASFVKELILLDDRYITEKTPRKKAYDILTDAFLKHCIAFNKFKVHIRKNNIASYEKAWNDLYHPYKDDGCDYAFLEIYFCGSDSPNEQKKVSEVVLKNINNLLKFAEYE